MHWDPVTDGTWEPWREFRRVMGLGLHLEKMVLAQQRLEVQWTDRAI